MTVWDPSKTPYPKTRRDEDFSETFTSQQRGQVTVKDPYHWLESPDSEETQAFVKAQGEFAQKYCDLFEDRDKFKRELTANWNFPRCER